MRIFDTDLRETVIADLLNVGGTRFGLQQLQYSILNRRSL